MAAFTTTQTLNASQVYWKVVMVTAQVNGGSVAVQQEYDTEDNWLTIDTISEDSAVAYPIGALGKRMRFVPSGGATFELKES